MLAPIIAPAAAAQWLKQKRLWHFQPAHTSQVALILVVGGTPLAHGTPPAAFLWSKHPCQNTVNGLWCSRGLSCGSLLPLFKTCTGFSCSGDDETILSIFLSFSCHFYILFVDGCSLKRISRRTIPFYHVNVFSQSVVSQWASIGHSPFQPQFGDQLISLHVNKNLPFNRGFALNENLTDI